MLDEGERKMSEKVNKKVRLTKPMTWAGVNYAPGQNEMPEAAANYAVKRKFGTIAGAGETVAELPEDFTPLPLEETIERMGKGDLSDEFLDSLKVHRAAITEHAKSGKPLSALLGSEKTQTGGGDELPEDFPMRHAFDKLGFKSVAEVQAKSREELIALDGIGETTADKALAYGK
jgi:hypothetical protein